MHKKDLTPFKEYLIQRLNKDISNGKKLFSEIQDKGFEGSYTTLYRYLKNDLRTFWKKQYKKSFQFNSIKSSINLSKYKRAITVETGPGEQGQIDWGHFGKVVINGRIEKLYCFVFVLGYSRALHIEFTTTQKLPVFETCHINAFKKLGIPRSIIYDNTKTVILSNQKMPDGERRIYPNLAFLDFAKYYGFEIIASHPYWPRDKGKVEAGVKYVRNNFMQGIRFPKNIQSLEQLNLEAQKWVDSIANIRIHANTNEKPIKQWLEEKDYLRFPNNLPDYQVSPFVIRFSTKDQFIQYKQNFYSVPKEYAWRKLFIREVNLQGNKLVNIYFQNELIAQHNLCTEKGKSIENPLHFKQDLQSRNITAKTNPKQRNNWKHYPEIPVRPFEYYDQLLKN